MHWRNCAYDTVLGGGSWQRWINIGLLPDTAGARYNAETGGNPANWTAGSYSCEGSEPIEPLRDATTTLFVTQGSVTGRETGTLENPFHTIAAAIAVCIGGESLVLFPGTYSEAGIIIPINVSIIGVSRRHVIISNANDIFTVSGGAARVIQNLTVNAVAGKNVAAVDTAELIMRGVDFTGRITLTGASAILRMYDCDGVGIVQINGGSVSTYARINATRIIGDATDLNALSFANANPYVIVESGSYLQGFAANPAVYWDTVTNDNLRVKHSGVFNGTVATIPFGRSGVQTPNFYAHHCEFDSDPEAGAIWTNLVPPWQRFNSIDPSVRY